MTSFFEQYTKLCKEQGKSVNGVAKEIGLPSSTITNWKHGKMPRAETIGKIASYFGVSVDYLQGYTDVKEKPTVGTVGMSETAQEIVRCLDGVDEATLKRVLEVVKLFVEDKNKTAPPKQG